MKKLARIGLCALAVCGSALAAGFTAGPFPTSPATTSTPYTFTFSPGGGAAPYTYAVTSGTLPPGLSLTAPTVLSGTPSVPGSYPLTFQVTDSNTNSATVSGTLVVNAGAFAAYTNLGSWQSASTGTQTSGTLPGSPGNEGQISGNSVTVSSVVISSSLLLSCGGAYPSCSSAQSSGWVTTGSTGQIAANYPHSSNVKSAGAVVGAYFGNNPQTLTVTGTTANGLSLTITAAPGTSTSFVGFVSTNPNDPVVSITMSADNPGNSAALIEVDYYASSWPALSILGESPLATAQVGVPYNLPMSGTGGSGSGHYSWSATGLPSGLTMNSAGVISGTPDTPGVSSNIQVTLTDTFTGQTAGPQTFSMQVIQPTSTSLNSSLVSPSALGQSITLTANVLPSNLAGVVTFYNGTTILGSKPLTGGQATLTTRLLPSGTNKLRAFYGGGPSILTSTSSVITQVVNSNAQGGFQSGIGYGSTAFTSATGDFNGDGIPDFATVSNGSSSSTLNIFLGGAGGTFTAGQSYSTGSGAQSIAVGDLNADGKADLAIANYIDGDIGIYLGNGDGTFSWLTYLNPGSGAANPSAIVIADFNGDGNADLATANGSNNISILSGTGTGSFGTPQVVSLSYTGNGLVAADFDGDGKTDLAVAEYPGNVVEVLLGTGGGAFASPVIYTLGNVSFPQGIVAVDLNGDGKLDLVTANRQSTNISILLGAANGTFGSAAVITVPGSNSNPNVIATGDFNGDGKLDVAVANSLTADIEIFTGDGLGGLTASSNISIGGAPTGLTAADYNGDGLTDLLAATGTQTVFLAGAPVNFFGRPIKLTWADPTLNDVFGGPQIVTVGPGVEFPAFFGNNQAFDVDFGNDTVTITSHQTRESSFDAGVEFNGLIIEIPSGSQIPNFNSVSLVSSNWPDDNANPFTRSRITFDPTHIYADFRGSVNQAGDSIVLRVNQSLTSSTTVLASGQNPSLLDHQVTFTATVPAGATGTVSFFHDSVDPNNFLANMAISGNTATWTTSSLNPGATSIVAFYNGDSTYDVSTSNTVIQNVQSSSSTTITSQQNPAFFGKPVSFTIRSAGFAPITITDGATQIGTTSTNSDGFASFQTSSLTPGIHTITATFAGDQSTVGSSGSVSQTILPPTTTTLSAANGILGKSATLTATVSPSDATGKVAFFDGATILGYAPVLSGTATLHTVMIPAGYRTLRALYTGSASYSSSVSVGVPVTIQEYSQSGFASPVMRTTGPHTIASVIGDFNSDGKQDVAVLDVSFAQQFPIGVVTVLLGAGDGTFQPSQQYTAGNDPRDLITGDYNGDGNPDLAVVNGESGVVLLTGGPTGAFSVGDPILIGADTYLTAAFGDFNGDGVADLLLGGSQQLMVCLGDGTGNFSFPNFITDTPSNSQVAVADMNSDGVADIFWNGGNQLNAAFGNNDGTFHGFQSVLPSAGMGKFVIADFNGDHWADAAIGTSENNVSLFLNAGDGVLNSAGDIAFGGSPYYIATSDFNGDGKLDLLTSDEFGDPFSIATGKGDGTFNAPAQLSQTFLFPAGIALASFRGNGRADLAVPNGEVDDVAIMLAQPGTITVTCPFTPFVLNAPYNVSCSGSNGVPSYTYSSTGTLPTGITLNTSTGALTGTPAQTGSYSFSIIATDSDSPANNGAAEFTVTVAPLLTMASSPLPDGTLGSPYSQNLVSGGTTPYFCTKTSGSLPEGMTLGIQSCQLSGYASPVGTYTFGVYVTDGGSPAQTASQSYTLTVQPAPTTITLLSNINPSNIGQQIQLTAQLSANDSNAAIEVYDGATIIGTMTNEDGIRVFRTSSLTTGTHSLTAYFTGDANNAPATSPVLSQVVLPPSTTTLTASPATPIFGQPVTLTATVTGGTATGKVTFYDGTNPLGMANISGGQATLTTVMLGLGVRSLTAHYLGSATLGYSTSAPLSKTIGVRPGQSISAATPYTVGSNIRHVAIGDFNGDGKQDLAAATYNDNAGIHAISILLANGDGTFQPAVPYDTGSDPHSFAVADFNGDGVQDLVVATPGGNTVTILTGNANGTFGAPTPYSATAADSLAVGDFNKDGYPDVVLGNTGSVYLMLGKSDGTLGSAFYVESTTGPTEVAVTDFDGDGNADIASVDDSGIVSVLLGTGDGIDFNLAAQQSMSSNPISITTADLNGDGHPDIVVGANGIGVRVFLVDASGVPAAPVTYTAGNVPGYVVTGDFDGDGKIDIAAADFSSSKFHTLTGNGNGTFNTASAHDLANPPFALAVGNFFGGTGRSDVLAGYVAGDIGVVFDTEVPIILSCTPASAPPVLTGVSYAINCAPTNGTSPFTYTKTSGSLPDGLSLNTLTGVISGTPTTAGTFNFRVQVTDSDNPVNSAFTDVAVVVVTPLTAAVSPLPGGLAGSPYSTTVYSGGTPPYTCGLSSGGYPPGLTMNGFTCVLSGTPSTPGTFSFTVGNSDSGSPQQNKTQAFSLTILQPTTTSLSPSANPATFGQPLTLTATVAPPGATGTVTFKDGSTSIGTGTLDGNGTATFPTSSLSVGTHSLTASYPGDSLNAASTSSTLTEAVKNSTTMTLTSSANPASTGQNITFTATVSISTSTGTVTFKDKGTPIGSGSVTNGVATFSTSDLTPGGHVILASYGGDANNFSSDSAELSQIVRTTTTTLLDVSPAGTAGIGAAVTLTATVSPISFGQVTFYNGPTVLGTSPLSNGIATLSTHFLPTGPNKLTAYYLGNTSTFASTSSGVSETISNGAENGFGSGVPYSAGTGPVGIATADFNGDGKADFVVADYGASTISITLGTGVGTVGTATPITVGQNPYAVAVGDFNGDGKTDIAASNLTDNSISVLLGNGDGTFASPVTYTAGIGTHPGAIVASDFNGDGFVDLAAVNYESNNVSVLLGAGDGTFGGGTQFSIGNSTHPAGLTAGDINNDGKIDLITANQSNTVSILPGNGDGTFAGAQEWALYGSTPQAIVAYDVDQDGNLDLITANQGSNNIAVFMGDGNAGVRFEVTYPTGNGPYALAVGDFDSDGKADIAVAQDADNNVGILTGHGDGGFTLSGSYSTGVSSSGARGIAIADLNRDGLADLVVSGYAADKISVMLGLIRTTTTLTSSVNPSIYGQTTTLTATVAPSGAAGSVTFFDGATQIGATGLSGGATTFDISTLGAGTHSLSARYNGDIFNAVSTSAPLSQVVNPVSTTTSLTATPSPSTPGQQITLTATVTPAVSGTVPTGAVTFNDGATAIGSAVTLDGSGQAVLNTSALSPGAHSLTAVYSGDANDVTSTSSVFSHSVQFTTTTSLTTSKSPSVEGQLVTFTATISSTSATGTVTFKDGLTALGTGTVTSGVATYQTSGLAAGPHTISAIYGGDAAYAGSVAEGINQIVQSATTTSLSVSPSESSLYGKSVLLSATVSPSGATGAVEFYDGPIFLGSDFLNNGHASISTQFLSAGSRSLKARYVGDSLDLPSTSSATTLPVTTLPGSGFGTPGNYTAGNGPSMITQADFNGDFIPDLAVVDGADTSGQGTVEVFFGNGDGTFRAGPHLTFLSGQNLDWIQAAELNNDGKPDLLIAGRAPGKLFAFLNDGEGNFGSATAYSTSAAPNQTAIAVGDFDGDGFADAAVSGDDGNVAILINSRAGGFNSPTIIPAGANPYGVTAGDFNGDGFTDLAFANFGNDTVTVIQGVGNGTFGAPATFSSTGGSGPFAIKTDDLNGDGKLDLVVSNLAGSGLGVSVLLGAGDGTFGSATAYATDIAKPSSLDFGDFNSDGKIDIAVASFTASTSSVTILTGDGAGAFASPVSYTGGAWPLGLVIGDFNGDGRQDIATANGNSATNNVSVLLSLIPTTTSLTSSLNPSTYGAPLTLTAQVSPSTASGSVTFKEGATVLGSGTLSEGVATLDIANLVAATHSITAVYAGDAGRGASTSSALSQVVNPTPTTTGLSSSLNPSTFGASVRLTASVSPSAATGSVTFKDGSATLSTVPLNGSGVAILDITNLSVASHSLTAVYGGDSNDLGSTSSVITQVVNQTPTTTTLTSSLNPSTFGASVILTATVSPLTGTASPGGTVTFKDGTTTIGTGTLSGGGATLTVSNLSVASHSLTVVYGGDTNDLGSTSSVLTQTVNQAPTTTSLTSSLNPSTFGAPVTLTATVAPLTGTATPTGTVTFKDGSTTLGAGTLNGSGVATYSTSGLPVGAHSLTASYGGDTNDATSTSSVLTQTVNQTSTTTTLTLSPNPSTFGTPVLMTGTVSPLTGTGPASGTVTFKDGAATIGTATLNGSGIATYGVSGLSVGSHSLTADYGGDTNDLAGSSAAVNQTVNQAVTTTTLTSLLNPATYGAAVTLKASVSPEAATGSVIFKEGSTVLGTGTVTNGEATFSTTTLSVGAHSLTADYGGDVNDATSTSSVLSQAVNLAPTTTTLQAGKPNPSIAGQSVSFHAFISPSNAGGTVTFKDGNNTLGTAPITAGEAIFDYAGLTTGQHSITASYGGDANDDVSTSNSVNQTVEAVTALSLSTDSNGFSTFGQNVTITATVDPPTATGTVTFYSGASVLGTSHIQQDGTASVSTELLPSGANILTAYYGGDSANAVSRAAAFNQFVIAISGQGFQPAVNYNAESQPYSQVPGDFNSDGNTDLAVANFNSNSVSILRGNGDGTFQDPANLNVGNGPTGIAAGDFNGDGLTDLAVANNGEGSVSILINTPDGFQPAQPVAAGAGPVFVVVGDYNRDGIADLATANSNDGTVSVLLGVGDGSFVPQSPVNVASNPRAIAVNDFDGDGIADLAVTSGEVTQVTLLHGVGDGTFAPNGTLTVGQGANAIATADLNNDGSADLVVANSQDGVVSVLLGNGDGTFQEQNTITVGNSPTSVVISDFNGDGVPDFAVPHYFDALYVALGNGDGTFQTPSTYPEGVQGFSAVAADFNFDGRADIAVANNGSGNVSVLLAVAQTVTSLTSSANPSTAGQEITLTAHVSPENATGTVTFLDGAAVLGTAPVSQGDAALPHVLLSAGSHSLTASYGGDIANAPSTSSPSLTQTVSQSGSITSLTSSANPSTFKATLTLTATVSGQAPTGSVTLLDGTASLGTVTLSGGAVTFDASSLPVGTHSLTAVYSGDANNVGSSSSVLVQTVNKVSTTISLTSSLNPSTYKATLALTAAVTGQTPTGSVTLLDGATSLGTATLSGGAATFDGSSLTVGAHSLTVVYGGDTNNTGSTSSVLTQTINKAPTTISLAPSLNPSTYKATLTLTATVTGQTPTGSVTLLDGATSLGTATLSGGAATFDGSSLPVGAHPLTIVYGGDTNNTGSTSSVLTQTINKAPTTISLAPSLNPSTYKAVLTLTATVTGQTPTGSVTLLDGATSLGTATLSGGAATFDGSSLPVGAHSLTVVYGGDTNNVGSTSPVLTQTVNQAPTTISLASSVNPAAFHATIILTATVSKSDATGTVTFKDDDATIGTGTVSEGTATLTIATLSAGAHALTAVYGGDSSYLASTSSILTQTVNSGTTTTTLTSSSNPSTAGTAITLTATVSPSAATGSVAFRDGATTLGTSSLSGGVATLLTSGLSVGSHSLTAVYAGDQNHLTSTSSVLNQTVSFSAPTITTTSLPAGQAGVSYGPITLQASGGSGNFSWLAGNLPGGITLSSSGVLSGTAAAAFSGTVTVTLTDTTSNQTASGSFDLTLTAAPLVISGTSNLGAVPVGGTLTGTFSAQGGTPPYSWSLSGAPAGFSVDSKGTVTGSPSQAGDAGFTLQLRDSTPGKAFTAGQPITYSAFGLATTSLLPASTLSDYSMTLTAAGGTAPYTFTVTGLPDGLTSSGASITGRPVAPGTFSVALKASDSKGLSVSTSLSLLVTGPGPLKVLSSSLDDGTVGQPYSQTISAEGGSPAYTWSFSGGVLPAGLSLNSSGTIFGTPTQAGSYSFGVQAKDAAGGQAVGAISINIVPAPLQITNGTSLPSGIAAAIYPTQILGAKGGIAPYTFTLQGTLPEGLSLKDGQISGTPTTPGDYSFSLIVKDSATPAASNTVGMSMTVRPNSADLVLSSGSLSFSLTTGTSAVPGATSVNVTSSVALQPIDFTVDASSASWLSVTGGGTTPASLSIGLSNAALALTASSSPYSGNVVLTCTSGACAGKSQTIAVTLTVTSPPPQLSLTASIFSFVASTSDPQPSTAALGIQNAGGGKLNVTSVSAADSWLSVTAFSGDVLPGPGAAVTVTADPASLGAGYYTSSVTVKTSAGNASIPVTLLVSAAATMVLGPDGTQFSMPVSGAPGNPAGSFLVSVSSTAGVSYTATVLPGATWLTGGGSGAASSASPGTVHFSIDPTAAAALPVGAYYGTIRVSGTGIVNTPQDFQVVLNVSPAATPVVPDPQPGGLLFLSATAGLQSPQSISVYASSKTPLPFQASATTNNGGGWLSISSKSGSAAAGAPAVLNALVDSTGLTPGVYTGQVNFASGPDIRSVNVTLVVQSPISSTPSLVAAASTLKSNDSGPTCSGAKLVPAVTGLVSNFSAPASWPTPISIQLVDTCGSVISRGQIVATFSNGDPPLALSLLNASTGVYSGTWTPRRTAAQTTINAQATATGYSPAVIKVAGQVTPNSAPQLEPNGTLDIFHPQVGAGLGPGNIVQIYGTGLASQAQSAEILPLPTKVGGTQVLIGGVTAPLFYVSPTQVNAQIPFELLAGQQYQVIVNANGALTTPQPIQLNAGVPALLQFTSGLVIAQHGDGSLISDTAPAAPGEFIVLYMTGLGATDIPVPTGQPSPAEPLAHVLDVPVLTLDDATVPLQFAGLTPGLVGLYQINLQVPATLPDKTYDLKVAQSGTVSNSTALPVKTPAPPAQ